MIVNSDLGRLLIDEFFSTTHNSITTVHPFKLIFDRCRINIRQNLFAKHVNCCNNLPPALVNVNNSNTFKAGFTFNLFFCT
jgi:hypothetical protein